MNPNAPVAQLDRALPSEGKGRTFESCRVRHFATILKYNNIGNDRSSDGDASMSPHQRREPGATAESCGGLIRCACAIYGLRAFHAKSLLLTMVRIEAPRYPIMPRRNTPA